MPAHPSAVPGPLSGTSTRPAAGYAAALTALALLFALRVGAQAIQRWLPLPFLPSFGAFQGSRLPYSILLPAQLAILAVMLRLAWRVHIGVLRARARAGRVLTVLGCLYFLVMLARLAIGLTLPDAPAWFHAPISAVFHLVLATFVLVLARYHRAAFPADFR